MKGYAGKTGIDKLTLLIISIFAAFSAGSSGAAEMTLTKGAASSFHAKVPDGLYLYQTKDDGEEFSPLFIVKDGKLEDPYAVFAARKTGRGEFISDDEVKAIDLFMSGYVTGRDFNVFIESELAGRLSGLDFGWANLCGTDGFVNDIQGDGKYDGKRPLPRRYGNTADASFYAGDKNQNGYFGRFGRPRPIAAPDSFKASRKNEKFIVTEEDRKRTVEAAEARFIPGVMERMDKDIKEAHKEKRADRRRAYVSRLVFLKALDMDGNGKKDFIGQYTLVAGAAPYDDNIWVYNVNALVFMPDKGDMEVIDFREDGLGSISVAGIIDLDQDGVYELLLRVRVDRKDDDGKEGKQIVVMRRSPAGWTSIYRSTAICGVFY